MRPLLLIVFCCGITVFAASFRLPITSHSQKVHTAKKPFLRSQHVLSSVERQSGVPIKDTYYGMFQTVNISIGTPRQSFRALLDIGWQDLLVPSIQCEDIGFCERASNRYNASASSTSVNLRSSVTEYFREWEFSGERMLDTVTIAGVDIEKQMFNSASSVELMIWVVFWDYEATLGLDRRAFYSTDNPLHSPSPWQSIMDRGLLDHNLFSIRIPQNQSDEGELILGEVDPAYVDELVALPLENLGQRLESRCPTAWIVQANSISFGDRHEAFPSKYHAVLGTAEAFIGLPEDFAVYLMDTIGAEKGGLQSVPCANRASMPELKVNLGPQGLEIVVSPWQYIMEAEEGGKVACWAPIVPITYNQIPDLDGNKFIMLGAAFMRSVYSVFDAESQTVSLAPLHV